MASKRLRFEKGVFKSGLSGNVLAVNVGFCLDNTFRSTATFFEKGNQFAKAENLTSEANQERFAALTRGWATKVRRRRGEKVMTAKVRKKISKTHRRRLHVKLIREMSEIRDMARMSATAAMQRMEQIVEDPKSRDSDAVSAAHLILERAYGKANQTTINATVDANGKPNEVGDKELNERIEKALARVEDIAGRAPKAAPSPQQPIDLRKLN